MGLQVFTEWGAPIAQAIDSAKHEAFALYAMSVIEQTRPDLFHFLNATCAKVIVSHGIFSFSMPSIPEKWFGDDEIANSLKLLPWAEPDEAKH